MVAASYNLGRVWGVCLDLAESWAKVSQTPSKHAQNLEKGMFSQECNRGGFGECPGLRILPLLHPCWVREEPLRFWLSLHSGHVEPSPPDAKMWGRVGVAAGTCPRLPVPSSLS